MQQDFKPDQDLWSYSELVEPKQDRVPIRQLRFASDPDYATKFQQCADHQLMFGGEDDTARSFHFRQARSKKDAAGRLFGLKVPEGRLGKLSGVLAVQLKMSRSGEVLGKELLFTTNTALGAEVLAAITDWITVASPGADLGPFEDLLYLDFEAGALTMGSQSHYVQTPIDGGRRPVS
ncbi:MAG TPA: hypothetical protein VHQ90_09935 [Thermoanaerobaculia bacterium]|nr:hypothetical protein [Thermoanaerobaculia bacterium]